MSDNSERNGSSRGRRGGQNRRRSGGGNSGGSSGGYTRSRVPRKKQPEPSGFSKFLNAVSFGLLGEASPPKRKPRPASAPSGGSADRPDRPERRARNRSRREPRSSKPEDVHTDRLYVGNLSYDAAESDLFELFNGVGAVQNAEVVVNSRTQRSKGFAFVTMASLEEARRAVEVLGGQDFMGRPLQLSGAKPVSRRDDEDRSDRSDRDESNDDDDDNNNNADDDDSLVESQASAEDDR